MAKKDRNGKPSLKILQTFEELVKTDIEFSYLVEDLIPDDSRTIIIGDPGVGKTTFAAQLCSALQLGDDFLNMATVKTRCLYFQADVGVKIWREQLKRIAPQSKAYSLHSIPSNALDYPEYIEVIKQVVQYVKPGFIVFDALEKLTSIGVNTDKIMQTVALIDILARDSDNERIPHMLVHHPSKDGKRGVNSGAGFHGIAATYDVCLSLTLTRLKIDKSRVSGNKTIRLKKDSKGIWDIAPAYGEMTQHSDEGDSSDEETKTASSLLDLPFL